MVVLNIRDIQELGPDDIYIGRANRYFGLPHSKWANPFKLTTRNPRDRQLVITAYREWVLKNDDLVSALPELRGKRLVCWCKPLPCHGDVLAELVSALDDVPAVE